MISPFVERELHKQLQHLPPLQQRQVLDFARALAATQAHGVSGAQLLRFAGTIAPDDLALISQAIAEGCETVNANDW